MVHAPLIRADSAVSFAHRCARVAACVGDDSIPEVSRVFDRLSRRIRSGWDRRYSDGSGDSGALHIDVVCSRWVTAPGRGRVRDCRNYKSLVRSSTTSACGTSVAKRAEHLLRGSYGRRGWHFRRARRAGFQCGQIGTVYKGATYHNRIARLGRRHVNPRVRRPRCAGLSEWAGQDSNLRPTDYDGGLQGFPLSWLWYGELDRARWGQICWVGDRVRDTFPATQKTM